MALYCWVGKHVKIVLKPTNDTTQGHLTDACYDRDAPPFFSAKVSSSWEPKTSSKKKMIFERKKKKKTATPDEQLHGLVTQRESRREKKWSISDDFVLRITRHSENISHENSCHYRRMRQITDEKNRFEIQ